MFDYISVNNLKNDDLSPFFLTETELKRINEPKTGWFVAESPKVISRALAAGYEPVKFLVDIDDTAKELAEFMEGIKDVPVYGAPTQVMSKITGYNLTNGLLCVLKRKPLKSLEEVVKNATRIVICEDVVNPSNLGTIFRSAAALSMDAVLLSPGCTDPLYRRSARVSMGNVFNIPWTFIENYDEAGLTALKNHGFKTAAMALSDNTVDIDDINLNSEEKIAVILGNEGDGLKSATIEAADYTVKIPMAEGVDSLNVAAAGAIAFWQLGHKK